MSFLIGACLVSIADLAAANKSQLNHLFVNCVYCLQIVLHCSWSDDLGLIDNSSNQLMLLSGRGIV